MSALFSPRKRIGTWRKIWLALAESQHELGLAIDKAQLDDLRASIDDIDFDAAAEHERKLRHDVMAHVHTFGDAAPSARGILHLGATSQDVVCNADLIILREGLDLVLSKVALIIDQTQ